MQQHHSQLYRREVCYPGIQKERLQYRLNLRKLPTGATLAHRYRHRTGRPRFGTTEEHPRRMAALFLLFRHAQREPLNELARPVCVR